MAEQCAIDFPYCALRNEFYCLFQLVHILHFLLQSFFVECRFFNFLDFHSFGKNCKFNGSKLNIYGINAKDKSCY